MENEERHFELHHIATGGTLDSHWDPVKDTAVPNAESIVPDYLKTVRLPRHAISSETLFLKDSRNLKTEDIAAIVTHVAESSHKRTLITTGTYSMTDVASAILEHPLSLHFGKIDKSVALTGAIIPLRESSMSDAGFNLGMSVAVLQEDIESRVVLVMNGICFDPKGDVRKDTGQAIFNSTHGKGLLGYDSFALVSTGGSIDFVPDGLDGFMASERSLVPSYLREHVKLQHNFDAMTPFVKDSRELNDSDLDTILDIIRASTKARILVTLGTYKMESVRKFLRERLTGSENDKTVVLTGSRIPLTYPSTDATFNLGYALGKIGKLNPGIHIALNGMMISDDDDIFSLLYTDAEKNRLEARKVIQ